MSELVQKDEHQRAHHRYGELFGVLDPLDEQPFEELDHLVAHHDIPLAIPRRVDHIALGPHDVYRLRKLKYVAQPLGITLERLSLLQEGTNRLAFRLLRRRLVDHAHPGAYVGLRAITRRIAVPVLILLILALRILALRIL